MDTLPLKDRRFVWEAGDIQLAVKPNEREEDYVARCVPWVIRSEGLTTEQATGGVTNEVPTILKNRFRNFRSYRLN